MQDKAIRSAAAAVECGPPQACTDEMRLPDPARRGVLGLVGLIGALPVLCACTTSPGTGTGTAVAPAERGLPELSGIGARMDAAAVYDRVSWGINDSGFARVQQMGIGRWLEFQLGGAAAMQGQELPAEVQTVIDGYGISRRPVVQLARDFEQTRRDADAKPSEEERAASRTAYQQALNVAGREAAQRFVLRALYSPAQLQEQMTWFWMNHFNVFLFKNNVRATIGDYEDRAIRANALGRFRDLLRATMLHPAMLVYLDNAQNAANRINENYARELMELHTLGVDAGYTQRDVQELARVLTGLGVNFGRDRPKVRADLEGRYVADGLFEFNPMRHDFGDKQFLGRTIRGRGLAEIDEVIDILIAHPSTACFVARKLAQYFVEDTPGEPLLERMVRAFRTDPGGDIAAMLRALFASPEFAASAGHRFKDPVHYVISAVRLAYDERVIVNPAPVLGWLNRLGQPLYGRQTPDGYPLTESAWSSAGQMNTRFEVARAIGGGNAGLFRAEGAMVDARPAFPQLANATYYGWRQRRLADGTRMALQQAQSAQEWNGLLLASPEFMQR